MNCCDSAGNCTNGPGCATRTVRSCDELGVCQERHQRCGGCLVQHDTAAMRARFATGPQLHGHLAPGVVEGYRVPLLGTPAQRRELARIVKGGLWWAIWCGLAGLAVGLIAGALQ